MRLQGRGLGERKCVSRAEVWVKEVREYASTRVCNARKVCGPYFALVDTKAGNSNLNYVDYHNYCLS